MADGHPPGTKLRFAFYMGWHRWCNWRTGPEPGETDYGEGMLRGIAESKHDLATVILRRGDHLETFARERGLDVAMLPEELCGTTREIRLFFGDPSWRRTRVVRDFINRIERLNLDVGIVYSGGWLPSQLFSLPVHGFVNYHPGPLPELPGFFPEMFLTLRNDLPFRGTLNQVEKELDKGRILAYTPILRHPKYTTAVDVINRMKLACPSLIENHLDDLAVGRLRPPVVTEDVTPLVASVARVNAESLIRWNEDSHDCIERRQRCFCCSVWGMAQPLHAIIDGEPREIWGIETYNGDFPGVPGQTVGVYRGQPPFDGAPVIRTLEGVAVAAPGRAFKEDLVVELPRCFLVREGRRKKRTIRKGLHMHGHGVPEKK